MKKKKSYWLPRDEAIKYTKNWQQCRTDDLPGLFYAYDEEEVQTERVVSFYLDGDQLAELANRVNKLRGGKKGGKADPKKPQGLRTPFRFLVHLGLRNGYRKEYATTTPHFQIMLEVAPLKNRKPYQYTQLLQWDPSPTFPTNPRESALSGPDAIPGESAFLFVHYWLETPHYGLGDPFESTAYQLGQRVKCYFYNPAESAAMADALTERGADGRLYVHLGRGITVSTHPFSFRPVVEIAKLAKNGREVLRGYTNDGDGGGAFFDFSKPQPPYDPPEG